MALLLLHESYYLESSKELFVSYMLITYLMSNDLNILNYCWVVFSSFVLADCCKFACSDCKRQHSALS